MIIENVLLFFDFEFIKMLVINMIISVSYYLYS